MLTYLNRKFNRCRWGLSGTAHVITCCAAALCILTLAVPQGWAQSPYRDGGYPERLDRDRKPPVEEEMPEETESSGETFFVPGVNEGPRLIPMRPPKKQTQSRSRSDSQQTDQSERIQRQKRAEQEAREEKQKRAEQKAREEQAKRAEQKAREEKQKRAEQKAREEQAKRAEQKAREEKQKLAEQKAREEQAKRAEQKAREEQRKLAEQKAREEQAKRAEQKAREEKRKLAEQKAREEQAKRAAAEKELNTWLGQMLMVGFKGQKVSDPNVKRLVEQIKSGAVGGVVFLSHNIVSPKQVKELTSAFNSQDGETPPFIAVDQEGGIVQRLAHEKGFAEYPTAGALGKRNDPLTAFAVYKGLANELRKFGFNLNMGPVVDLLYADTKSIIAIKERAFGSKPMHVTAFAKAFCAAHKDAGVLTVLKHFPGHGSTAADTHTAPAEISKTWSEDELVPYQKLIESGNASMIMVGHITHAKMADEPGLPASLSKKAITDQLRGKLKFSGVVISDDLEMAAVSKKHPLEDSVVRAIEAGVDIVLLGNQVKPSPDLPDRVAAIIRQAVADGKLKRERLKASFERIIALKSNIKTQASKPIVSANQDSGHNGGPAPAGR